MSNQEVAHMQDKIEKQIVVKAPIARVWRAISDSEQFGEWFRVKLDGPFVLGEVTTGKVTVPGFEHMIWRSVTTVIEAERRLAFTWNPYDYEPYDDETEAARADAPQMLVEFRLESTDEGTRVTIVESGFASLPDDARREAMFLRNEGGWNEQVSNIKNYVEV